MPELQFEEPFDIGACKDCPHRNECAVFDFADAIRRNLDPHAYAIAERFGKFIHELTTNPTGVGRDAAQQQLNIIHRRIDVLFSLSAEVEAITTVVIKEAIKAQLMPEGEEKSRALKEGLSNAMQVDGLGVSELDIQRLDRIGTDARYYTSTGKCGAIEIFEE